MQFPFVEGIFIIVTVKFPVQYPLRAMNDAVHPPRVSDLLIIDPQPAGLTLLARALAAGGCSVRSFQDDRSALDAIEAAPPDIILLDVRPPNLDGFQICQRLKNHPLTCDIPIICISELHGPNYELRAFEAGAVDYIVKPLQASQVQARIRNHLRPVELHRQLKAQNALLQQEISERRRIQDNLAVQAEELSALYRMGLLITSGLDLSHILDTLQQQLSTLIPIDVFYMALYDADNDQLHLPAYFERNANGRLAPDENVPAFTARPSGFAAYILQSRQMLYVPDAQDPAAELPIQPVHLGGSESRAYLGLPLIWQNNVIGLLSVQSYRPNTYTPDHIRLIQAVAVQAAIAVQNVRLYQEAQEAAKKVEATNLELNNALIELERLATTDKLTGAYNRRKFDEILNQEIKRALRLFTPLSVILFDIDHFKDVNDLFGHITGDRVLADVAQVVKNSIRCSDTLTRWGGEEFLVLCPGNNLAQSLEMAERLRVIIEQTSFPIANGITISLGVSEFQTGDTPDRFIMRADNALYHAKNNGRNCVGLAN